ncbi:hypothetical protein HOP50_05g40080 [Chloropicon primus]|uniref:Uncharacterized protein n=1 Tax=Chloropicon primus TaxID=1764295 RepID=A0A5B8MLW2_9CHLO|nr:hypothetical protein A3770_05p40010 [Chloropicon primus]UPR00693.1 hypothetical protein HOP50_05g40080 [Chloropicon primus]|eukprot:QDZ21483.1 hypothetical protein A3770_05p40010 [Chloropicon primus]
MDWSRQKKKTKPRVPQPRPSAKAVVPKARPLGRSRSNSFVLSRVFDETIESESKRKDTPTNFLARDGEEIIELQDVEYDFGSEWLVKSPPEKKPVPRIEEREIPTPAPDEVARHKLPPLPRKNQEPRGEAAGKPPRSKAAVARRVSSLPKPIQQIPKGSPENHGSKQRNAETQTEQSAEDAPGKVKANSTNKEFFGDFDILKEIRLCGDLLQEMVESACDLSELYQKERRRTSRKQKACCTIM